MTDEVDRNVPGAERRQVRAILGAVDDTIGSAVVAVYLHGSAIAGGLKTQSDVDILVATARRTTPAEKQALTERLLAISNRDDLPGFERPLELTIVAGPDVRPWRYPPPMDFQYGEWLRDAFERGELEPDKPLNPDLAIVLTAVLASSLALVGPPATDLFDPVPASDLRRAMTDELPSLLADLDTDTRNIILTLARVWLTLATGEVRPKDRAADWVLARLPAEHGPVLARARAIYLGDEDEHWADLEDRLVPFVDRVLDEIARITGSAPPVWRTTRAGSGRDA